jgi:hypothetical protein
MKKLLAVLGICAILICVPMVSASPMNLFKHRGLIPRGSLNTGGTFSGVFAEKNETGYNILGTISGTYTEGINWSLGTIDGIWAMDDASASGNFSGSLFHRFFFGQYYVTGGNSSWFIGLFRTNETTNEFQAITLVFAEEDYLIRYGIGTYIETN